MDLNYIHVYLMPGMAANSSIFEYIQLPPNKFEIHLLEWIPPIDNEALSSYARRMSLKITHDNSVLIGVSFGGVLVQEMSLFRDIKKIIIISSIKSKSELPKKMYVARRLKLYKFLPTQLVAHFNKLSAFNFGQMVKKRLALYQKYLSINDKRYLDWAIFNMVCWDRNETLPNIVHIHGNKDTVFPIQNISNCIVVEGGTHIMILNKYKWLNKHLPQLIMS